MAITSLPNEDKLLIEIAEGDKHSFAILFNHYQRFVYSFSRRLTHSEDIAINMVQNVFLKIWEDRYKLPHIDNFGAYLNRTVRNHSFNSLRNIAYKNKNTVELDAAGFELDYSTQYKLDYDETVKIVNEALNLLSVQQRKAYELCHQQGLKYEEAAAKLGISKGTLQTHMKLALRNIREYLRQNGVVYPLIAFILCS